jgi:hypothetical protein
MNLRDEILVNLQDNPREVPILRKLACTKCVTLTLNTRKKQEGGKTKIAFRHVCKICVIGKGYGMGLG